MTQAVLKLPKLHAGQKGILKGSSRFNTITCGRRWGKSVLGLDILIDSPLGALNGYPTGYFAPSYKLLDASFRDIKRLLKPIIKRVDGSQKRIELITGGSVDFWTLLDPDAGRSRKYSEVVLDESAHVKELEQIWTKSVRATLADYQGRAWFLSSPNGSNYFKTGLFDRGDITHKSYDSDWASFQMPTSSNPYIAKAEIESARKELPELAFRQEFLAEFVSVAGALLRPSYLQNGTPPDTAKLKTVVGVDLAISIKDSADYTALVVLSQDLETGKLYVQEVVRFRGTFNEILKEITRVCAKWSPSVVGIEKVQFQASVIQELLRTTQLNAIGIVPKGDKIERFQPIVARYENSLIYHDAKLIPEFEKELLVFPMGSNSPDMVDAFAHAFKSLSYSATPTLSLQVPSL